MPENGECGGWRGSPETGDDNMSLKGRNTMEKGEGGDALRRQTIIICPKMVKISPEKGEQGHAHDNIPMYRKRLFLINSEVERIP